MALVSAAITEIATGNQPIVRPPTKNSDELELFR